MPPKKTKKATKPKNGKGKTTRMSQVQKTHVNVRVGTGGGRGGGVSAPIVYATFAPASPAQPTLFVFDNGLPPAPVMRGPTEHILTGVSYTHKYPSRPQPHHHVYPLSQYLVDSVHAGAPPSLSSIYSETHDAGLTMPATVKLESRAQGPLTASMK